TFQICAYDGGGGALTNDDPCFATTVAVGASCSFSTYTNVGATNTAGAPAPTCASYSGGDVWFQVTVPPSGSLVFDSNTGTMTDGGMAIYSGTCGSLTQIACDDDGSTNGAMPYISNGSLTPGSTIWIRFWDFGGGNGTFQLCVYEGVPVTPPGGNVVCGGMTPICSDTPVTFTASTGGTAASVANPLNNYGCLFTSPNPTWYYLQLQTGGNIVIDMGAGSDIDFALWGPFANLTAAQNSCVTGYSAPLDCSYSISATEQANVTGAVAGQVYVLLVTNYADVSQVIDLNSGAGNTALTDCSIILPIELIEFYATTEYATNSLHWTTETEQSNDQFFIERSYNGTNFTTIGTVDGAGSSSYEINYEFTDRDYTQNLTYYRLKQIDFDGAFKYSSIVSVNRETDGIKIYPNPTSGAITIDFPSGRIGNYTLKITDPSGKIYTEKLTMSDEIVSYSTSVFEKLNAGIYFAEIIDESGNLISVHKILKAK
ncbi:MAG: T9SS type A sorting domain-containing protein, partial [Crocinitomicaceae bacterium]|nr:T9SS type A sorting domain-containing protein [Crocinitomicaceae bacterium]